RVALLARAQRGLDLTPPRSLNHEPDDQHRLHDDEGDGAGNHAAVALPYRRLLEPDLGAGRKASRLHVPALELPSVEDVGELDGLDGDVLRALAVQDPRRQRGELRRLVSGCQDYAADDAKADVRFEE